MKKLLTILLLYISFQSYSQEAKWVHISVVHGLSTGGSESKNVDYNFSFNLFSGRIHSLKGLEMGLLYNQNDGDMIGLQQSGLVNLTKGNVKGVQIAGLSTISRDVIGVQYSGLSNHSKDFIGVQMAGLINISSEFTGLQTSGLLNKATTLKGLQYGLINIADSVGWGGGIGLINLYKKNGYKELELSFSDYQNIGLNFRSGTKNIYSILNVGYNFYNKQLFSYGLGVGRLNSIGKSTFIKTELVDYIYVNDDWDFDDSIHMTHLRAGLMKTFGAMGISLSPSIYCAKNSDGILDSISELKPFSKKGGTRFGYGISFGISYLFN